MGEAVDAMIEQQPQRPRGGDRVTEQLSRQAEAARARFDRELRGLIEDLRDARRAVRERPLPGERGDGEEVRDDE